MSRFSAIPLLIAFLVFNADIALAQSATPSDCAAFWYGRDDYAKNSKILPRDPADLRLAKQAEAEATRLDGNAPAQIESARGDMKLIFEASIELQDQQSSDLQQSLTQGCTALSASLP